MKKLVMLAMMLALIVVGCTTTRDVPTYTEVPPGSGNVVTSTVPQTVVDPRLEAAIAAIRAGNAATAPVNPWASLIDYFLVGVSGIATLIAARKNALLKTVIKGVENAGDAADPVKASIRNLATATGQEGALGRIVQKITE